MSQQLGIARDRESIEKALDALAAIGKKYEGAAASASAQLDLKSQLLVSRLIAQAALRREESRGAHYRLDYPEPRECWKHHSIEELQGGAPHVQRNIG